MSELTITSVRNPRVQAAVRLREGRERAARRQIVIDGVRELRRAVDAGVRLVEVFVCAERLSSDAAKALVHRLRAAQVPLIDVAAHVFEKLAFGARAEGVVAVAETPQLSLANLKLPAQPLVAVLEGCEKPGNLGAVLRSADAAGLSAVIVADPRTDVFNPNAIRASLGTVFTLPLAVATSAEVLALLRERVLNIVAARVEAKQEYTAVDFTRPTAIVLGSEATGLSDAWRASDVQGVQLPMRGIADSLNVSTTAAVLFYEALRQRRADVASD